MNFDIRPFSNQFEINDKEWEMIIQSEKFMKIGKCFFATYREHVITFIIRDNGLIELLNKCKKPCANYMLPIIGIGMSFNQKLHCYLEQQRLLKGLELDVEHFKRYGT